MSDIISPLPAAPSRSDPPATFATKADAFVGALGDFVTEANLLADTVEGYKDAAASSATAAGNSATAASTSATAAATSASAASAVANFQGNWSALTGALNIPASVQHNGNVWMLLTNLADVTASEPSDANANWARIIPVTVDGDIDFDGDVIVSGSLSVTGPAKHQEMQETVVALSGTTPTVDLEAGTVFTLTTSGNTTFTFSNPAATGTASAFSLRITAGGSHTVTWPASVDWAGGSAPDAPASGETDVLAFFTTDGGTTWFGFLAGDALA